VPTGTSTNTATVTATCTATNSPTVTATPTNTPVCQLVGFTTVSNQPAGNGALFWNRDQAPVGTTQVTGYNFYLYAGNYPGSESVTYEMALYTDNSGSVGNLIAGSDTGEVITASIGQGLQTPTLTTPVAITAGNFYWIAFMTASNYDINFGSTSASYMIQNFVLFNALPANGSGATATGINNPINQSANFCQ
jgi:hypothetical protein